MDFSTVSLNKIINHAALPPRVPQQQDSDIEEIESIIGQSLLSACVQIRDFTATSREQYVLWESVRLSLHTSLGLSYSGQIDRAHLLASLPAVDNGLHLVLFISEQNAGLLIYKTNRFDGDHVVFEAFEASASSDEVLSAQNALVRCFPGRAVEVPMHTFNDTDFQVWISDDLERLSVESLKKFASTSRKDGSGTHENRETTSPEAVTGWLMSALEGFGRNAAVLALSKRTYDQVNWHKAEMPWRRSSLLTIFKIGLARILLRLDDEAGRVLYKYLIAVFLAQLLDNTNGVSEAAVHLRTKIGYRMTKLQTQREGCITPHLGEIFDFYAENVDVYIERVLVAATKRIIDADDLFKRDTTQTIPYIPRTAKPIESRLKLEDSHAYISRAIQERPVRRFDEKMNLAHVVDANKQSFITFYRGLADQEIALSSDAVSVATGSSPDYAIQWTADELERYINIIGNAYDANPSQMSSMLLLVLEAWIRIDMAAKKAFPLLNDFHPPFPPRILDTLRPENFLDMQRLSKIQQYLDQGVNNSKYDRSIFSLEPGCFAERFFESNQAMKDAHNVIVADATAARAQTEQDWELKNKQWRECNERYHAKSHWNSRTGQYVASWQDEHYKSRCPKCLLYFQMKKIKISVHEWPLVKQTHIAKATVFELYAPEALLRYRDTTAHILRRFTFPQNDEKIKTCHSLVRQYDGLSRYGSEASSSLTLGSLTKSEKQTHRAVVKFPVKLRQVCPEANHMSLAYIYSDSNSPWWVPNLVQRPPSFMHHFADKFLQDSPFESLRQLPGFSIVGKGPTSNEVIAAQVRCPSKVGQREWTAYQMLFSGYERRLPQLLLEIGSSDLNFGSDAVVSLVIRLATQAGPSAGTSPLRIVHLPLKEAAFRRSLYDQLHRRLDALQEHWRETVAMRLIIVLALRLCCVGDSNGDVSDGLVLVAQARQVLQKWVIELRQRHSAARDRESAARFSKYAFEAALLCKKTFVVFTFPQLRGQAALAERDLQCFILSSVTAYEHLVDAPNALPQQSCNDLAEDAQLGYRLEPLLYHSLTTQPETVLRGIVALWPSTLSEELTRHLGTAFLKSPHQDWLEMKLFHRGRRALFQYHVITGCTLINGQPHSTLPDELSRSPVLEELFGHQNFETLPSMHADMTYHLRLGSPGYEVHLGFRGTNLIVRLMQEEKVLEFVPRSVFGSLQAGDLPTPLLEGCVHWLDVSSGMIEIRPVAEKFISNETNWRIDFYQRIATRIDGSLLVERGTHSHNTIARVFRDFERVNQLVIFQKEQMSVELPRSELTFIVNARYLLECEQLHGELQPKQDCGTWYGLVSKLVLQDTVNPRLKTVIVPLGRLACHRNGVHVTVTVDNSGLYGKFTVNYDCQRIDSPPEPRLFYTKALLHAMTSLVSKDTLNGMTGTDAAIRCLESSLLQPYTPLTTGGHFALPILANLSPKRVYYPEGRKVQQNISWDENLPYWTQNEAFRPLAESIRAKSDELVSFTPGSALLPRVPSVRHVHLSQRSLYGRGRYECMPAGWHTQEKQDTIYNSRDAQSSRRKHVNVFQCARLLHQWNGDFPSTHYLLSIVQSWSSIAGFEGQVAPTSLSDRFDLKLSEVFGSLLQMCRDSNRPSRYRLALLLSPFCYNDTAEMDIIRTLVAVAISDSLKVPIPPKWPFFERFTEGNKAEDSHLVAVMKPHAKEFSSSIQSIPNVRHSARQRRQLELEKHGYTNRLGAELSQLAEFVRSHNFGGEVDPESCPPCSYVDTDAALPAAVSEWQRLTANYELSKYLTQLQEALVTNEGTARLPRLIRQTSNQVRSYPVVSKSVNTSLSKLLRMPEAKVSPPPHLTMSEVRDLAPKSQQKYDEVTRFKELERLIRALKTGGSQVRATYANDLDNSFRALLRADPSHDLSNADSFVLISEDEIRIAEEQVQELHSWIVSELRSRHTGSNWLEHAGLWPSMNTSALLSELRSQVSTDLGNTEKALLVELGLCINTVQRLKRISDAEKRGAEVRAHQERINQGHTNWSPTAYPDWLLIEVDSNVTIREEQVEVAKATIDPPSAKNSCLQLNMGGGKSSVILPMCASVLANRNQLVRIVVPRALLLQTAQVLQTRLGGLLDREIRHVPFSRRTPQDVKTVNKYRQLHEEVLNSGGVMLCLPEHMLSFKLSGQQCLADEKLDSGKFMAETQLWFESKARDVVDECDEILSTKQQLVFPSGAQLAVDGHPYRWEVIQYLLHSAAWHAEKLAKKHRDIIEVVRRDAATFPTIFFLRPGAEETLTEALIEDICTGYLNTLPLVTRSKKDISTIRQYLTKMEVDRALSDRIHGMFADNPRARNTVYLVRGALTYGILNMALSRRFNVQYGLHPDRDPIAVPYHAKGSPSDHAEWGHPDVSLLFTTLSFYYGGLTIPQLKQALDHLLHCDDPAGEYNNWIGHLMGLPPGLQHWSFINTGDSMQMAEVHQHLSHNQPAVRYFLNRFVFPVHAKQFSTKLQASGWDLPQFSPHSKLDQGSQAYPPMTTGFSGTNDLRNVLPLTVKQNDLPALLRTNAGVLIALLETRNRDYFQLQDTHGRRLTEFGMLDLLIEQQIPILIDAGAAVVSTTNEELVSEWLKRCNTAPAAVYFDRQGKAIVRYRKGHQTPLLASPYAEDLSQLLVFVDHQHVRGTDLKFPMNARGAVTLAGGQTKDHTVQAAMRLRQLQTTQSVCWLAPPEVHQSIVDAMAPERGGKLDSYDVVWWLLEQSCRSIEQSLPLFTVQGENFCEQLQARITHQGFLENATARKMLMEELEQVERHTLVNLYDPFTQQKAVLNANAFVVALRAFVNHLATSRKAFQEKGVYHSGSLEEVEQEREVTAEAEIIRELQKPWDFLGLPISGLHEDIKAVINGGNLKHSSTAWTDVFTAMSTTAIGKSNGVNSATAAASLYVSHQFQKTIETKHKQYMDNFTRPVNWILLLPATQQALLVSPEEAEFILPMLRAQIAPKVNLTLYAAPVTRKMRVFEELRFYSVPALPHNWTASLHLKVLLGMYAGFLYFDHETFQYLREFLEQCKLMQKPGDSPLGRQGVLIARPLSFFKAWLDVRRKGQEFYETPAGYVSQGKDLDEEHVFFR